MMNGWIVVGVALSYIVFLFLIATYGDRRAARQRKAGSGRGRPIIYAFALGVYCTSWTFFGSVGYAANSGLDFIAIYLGPFFLFLIGTPLIRRIIRLSKAERITSTADFLAARYGKSQPVAALVTLIVLVGTLPYISLQLKAVSSSVATLVILPTNLTTQSTPFPNDIALLVTLSMAAFAIMFGTRHVDATEHQEGMMLAIAAESVIKLVAFLVVGLYITYGLFDGLGDLFSQALGQADIQTIVNRDLSGGNWLTMLLLSVCAGILLPRQFHMTVVEQKSDAEVKTARTVFPLYLILINLFVLPIALAGLLTFGKSADPDMFVLALPLNADALWISTLAFLGGLSAATAMVIVASVALSIMISNDLIVPFILHRGLRDPASKDMNRVVLTIRRASIIVILFLAYLYYRVAADSAALASIGLISFAAIAQIAPAFFGGLVWRHGTARGAFWGMAIGFLVWGYTILMPTFAGSGLVPQSLLDQGPFGISLLKPQQLFNIAFEPLTHGVFWSLTLNLLTYMIISLMRPPQPIERLQANVFVPSDLSPAPALRLGQPTVTIAELEEEIARYLGEKRAKRTFERFAQENKQALPPSSTADIHLLRFAEQVLASAVGAASARLVMSLLLKRRTVSTKAAIKLLDEASSAIQYNRDLLQIALEHVAQGLSVYNRDLQLICWNRQFREMLDLPAEFGQVGTPLTSILRHNASKGEFGSGLVHHLVSERIEKMVIEHGTYQERMHRQGTVLEVRSRPMPDGGIVVTFTDITERVHYEEALSRAKDDLEKRVLERTHELTLLNNELQHAKAQADEANISKTRFLAAAGHDIVQPLNAARLYVTSLVELKQNTSEAQMIGNVDASLGAVEEILGAVLDISRLDAGAMKPEISVFPLAALLSQLKVEFTPLAEEKNLTLTIVSSSKSVRSDRRLLRRILQNLVSNAIKYTRSGHVLVGVRHRGKRVRIEVLDSGIGIPERQQKVIFQEFQRLDEGAREARGLGLGLSIVERISRVLNHPISVSSEPGRGTHFTITVPWTPAPPMEAQQAAPQPHALSQLNGLAVLCIDNEQQILDGMEALLTGWGCTVITALNTRDAIQRIREQRLQPDVLLVDYHLDNAIGLDAAVEIRWKFGADLPAILITADRSKALREEAASKHIEVLNKPLKPAALRALLTQWAKG